MHSGGSHLAHHAEHPCDVLVLVRSAQHPEQEGPAKVVATPHRRDLDPRRRMGPARRRERDRRDPRAFDAQESMDVVTDGSRDRQDTCRAPVGVEGRLVDGERQRVAQTAVERKMLRLRFERDEVVAADDGPRVEAAGRDGCEPQQTTCVVERAAAQDVVPRVRRREGAEQLIDHAADASVRVSEPDTAGINNQRGQLSSRGNIIHDVDVARLQVERMSQPRISFCIPTRNFGRFIGATLARIADEAGDDVEVVIVDGNSTDDTADVVRGFEKRIRRLVFQQQTTNGGIDRALAHAVQLARGEYCWLLSSEDVTTPGAIRRMLSVLSVPRDVVLVDRVVCDVELAPLRVQGWLDIPEPGVFAVMAFSTTM